MYDADDDFLGVRKLSHEAAKKNQSGFRDRRARCRLTRPRTHGRNRSRSQSQEMQALLSRADQRAESLAAKRTAGPTLSSLPGELIAKALSRLPPVRWPRGTSRLLISWKLFQPVGRPQDSPPGLWRVSLVL